MQPKKCKMKKIRKKKERTKDKRKDERRRKERTKKEQTKEITRTYLGPETKKRAKNSKPIKEITRQ
jgi:hypothetical protein